MIIKSTDDTSQRLLQAAADGDLSFIIKYPDDVIRRARCSSGCTMLHWAAGGNHVDVLNHLLSFPFSSSSSSSSSSSPTTTTTASKSESNNDYVNITAAKKSKGRTPLHYACRNGCLTAARWLVDRGADVNARAKHGISPFQLAVWQNQLEICVWLVVEHNVDPGQVNDFDCNAIHWLGTSPLRAANRDILQDETIDDNDERLDGRGLLPLAKWLALQPTVDFQARQRQGHSALHKAAWGGHISLLQYLRDTHSLLDSTPDHAGNYAADLADMAQTPRHARVASYLRRDCSHARAQSCRVLGVELDASREEIRRAFLEKVKLCHPDRRRSGVGDDFDGVKKAYDHLIREGGRGYQSNPSHSIRLMLALHATTTTNDDTVDDNDATTVVPPPLTSSPNHSTDDDDGTLFKARLLAVLLEYGNKGLALSNIRKKWNQVWTEDRPFPDINSHLEDDDGTASDKRQQRKPRRRRRLAQYIEEHAGDVVEIVYRNNDDGDGGYWVVIPRHVTRDDVRDVSHRLKTTTAETMGSDDDDDDVLPPEGDKQLCHQLIKAR